MKKQQKIDEILKAAGKRKIISDKNEAWALFQSNLTREKEGLPLIEFELSSELQKDWDTIFENIKAKRAETAQF